MGRRMLPNAGRITDYSQREMQDPATRRAALDDYIGRWCGASKAERADLVRAACEQADRSIDAAQSQASDRTSARVSGSAAVPSTDDTGFTMRDAWKAWV